MKRCLVCSTQLEDSAWFCPKCGSSTVASAKGTGGASTAYSLARWGFYVSFVSFLFLFMIFLTIGDVIGSFLELRGKLVLFTVLFVFAAFFGLGVYLAFEAKAAIAARDRPKAIRRATAAGIVLLFSGGTVGGLLLLAAALVAYWGET